MENALKEQVSVQRQSSFLEAKEGGSALFEIYKQ